MPYSNKELTELYKNNLKYLIKTKNLTQRSIANDVGFSKNLLSTYLTTERVPSIIIGKALADYLDTPVDSFFSKNTDELENHTSITKKLTNLNTARLRNVEHYIDRQLKQQAESTIIKLKTKDTRRTHSKMDDYVVVGNSMVPLFNHNDIIQVDTSDSKHLIDGMYYALKINKDTYIKKIVIAESGEPTLELHSLNTNFDTTYLDEHQKFTIIGRIHATITI